MSRSSWEEPGRATLATPAGRAPGDDRDDGATPAEPTAALPSGAEDAYLRWVRPDLGPLMEALGLMVTYHRGSGDRLYAGEGAGEIEVLDLVGGYGANLLGHGHPAIREALMEVLAEGRPFLAQGSRRPDAAALVERLAAELREETGQDYLFAFSSSGTEAVNLALLHAHLEFGRRWAGHPPEVPVLLMLEGGFHGVLLQAVRKRGFPGPRIVMVPANDREALEEAFERERRAPASRIMALLVETIQGEGGVRPLEPAFLETARKLTRRDGVPLVIDEVQTGFGRTGRLLDSMNSGVAGDYVALAKALGGGMTKIGLTLIERSRWVERFDSFSLSTFQEDPFSCRAAARTLDLLTRDRGAALASIRRKGERFKELLEEVRAEFPDVVREVRGRGLMLGVELANQDRNLSNGIGLLSESDLLGYGASAWFLARARIRVMPPVGSPRVLRLQPSMLLEEADMVRFTAALREFCTAIRAADCGYLLAPLVSNRPARVQVRTAAEAGPPMVEELPPRLPRVAFLGHFIQPEHVALWDPSFERFDGVERDRFLRRFGTFMAPRVFRSFTMRSRVGAEIGYMFLGLAQTSATYAEAWRSRRIQPLREQIERGVEVARAEGARVVGFGGFTSIVTDNLKTIDAPDLVLTTGNAYTVAAGVDALVAGARERGIGLGSATLAVVGALGNIASVWCQLLAPRVERLLLVGRPNTRRRLERFKAERFPAELQGRIEVHTGLEPLSRADLVLAATNSPEPVVFPEHLDPERPVVVCDISIPPDAAPELDAMPNVSVIRGGLVHAEGNDHVCFPGVPLARGQLYACMAETALLGLDGATEDFSRGPISVEQVERIRQIAVRHGFRFLGPKLEPSL